MLANILIGLIGLGLVVFVHELGHLLIAKAVGIDVEAFSVGWGRRLFGFTYRGTDYRLSLIPIGGYCRMKGEQAFQQARQENLEEIPRRPGEFFSASPWRRIAVALAGPAANLVFAVLIFSIIWWIGFSYRALPNRIILASQYDVQVDDRPNPADSAGLQSGDRIVEIDGRVIEHFGDIRSLVSQSVDRTLAVTVRRGGDRQELELTPQFDADSGVGRIGIYPWVEPIVASVEPESPAAIADLRPEDRILAVNERPIVHTIDFDRSVAEGGQELTLVVTRGGAEREIRLFPGTDDDNSAYTGIGFRVEELRSSERGPVQALQRGVTETVRILSATLRGLRLLFYGQNITRGIAGPIQLTSFVGQATTSGLEQSLWAGVRMFFSFISFLSVALCFMNLLPIPVLDGGQTLLYLIEGLIRRPIRPRIIYRYQVVGGVIIIMLLALALFSDVLFLFR